MKVDQSACIEKSSKMFIMLVIGKFIILCHFKNTFKIIYKYVCTYIFIILSSS